MGEWGMNLELDLTVTEVLQLPSVPGHKAVGVIKHALYLLLLGSLGPYVGPH